MPVLRFFDAMPCPSLVETLDYSFAYRIDYHPEAHWIRVVGGPQRWEITPEEQQLGSQYLFAAAIFVIESEWTANRKLPKENRTYWEKTHFPKVGLTSLNWVGYRLTLPD